MAARIDRASKYVLEAISLNPRAQIQKELGWLSMEQGRVPTAISMLTDQRNASDYEAYNLLLKCFYLTDRFEAGESLAATLMDERAPNDCFRNNRMLCRLLNGDALPANSRRSLHATLRTPSSPTTLRLRQKARGREE